MAAPKTKEINVHLERIKQLYAEGWSAAKIAKDLGFSPTAILKRLKDSGVYIVDSGEKRIDLLGEAIKQRYENGEPITKIAKDLKFHNKTISKKLKELGIIVKLGRQLFREKNHSWKGGKFICGGKHYKILIDGRGYINEARIIIEKQLGRKLDKYEYVFHKDGNTLNNAPENLYLSDKTTNGDEVAQMYEMYKTGTNNIKIGKAFNIQASTVMHRLKKYGYKTRDMVLAAKPRQKKRNEYVKIRDNDGKIILEHRYIMEQFIGRKLEPYEIVHHRNKNKRDNRIENLVLCSSNSEHMGLYHAAGKIEEYEKIKKEIFEEQKALREETEFLHRKIVEENLKIRLTPYEHVIHLNGNKLDNNFENLITMRDIEKINKIYELYQNGLTLIQAAKQFGVGAVFARRAFEIYGYHMRSKKEQMELYNNKKREKRKKFFEDIEKDEDFGQPL